MLPSQVFLQKPSEAGLNLDNWRDRHISRRRICETAHFDDILADSVQRRKRRASSESSPGLGIVAQYCGLESYNPKMFGALFPNRSFPMDASSFVQIDPLHWVLDMSIFVGEAYDQVQEICIFLLNEFSLPPDKALAVYVQSPGSEFQYCGAVHRGCPSAVLSLLWPSPGGLTTKQLLPPDAPPLGAKIGLSIEDLASLSSLNVGQHQKIEALALKVGQNLFNFMQSFCSVDGNKLVVPMDILDKWFLKLQERSKRDPEYLKNFMD